MLIRENNRKIWLWQTLYLISALVSTLAVILSLSRAAWLNLAVSLVVYFGLMIKSQSVINREGLRRVGWVILVLLGCLALLYFLPEYARFHSTITKRLGLLSYDTKRFNNFHQAFQLSLANPWGIGPGQTLNRLQIATHNTYLRVSLENGWLGIISYSGFLIVSVMNAAKLALHGDIGKRSLYLCITALLLGTMVNSLFIDTLHWRHFWILLALAW